MIYTFLDQNLWLYSACFLALVFGWSIIIYFAYPKDQEPKISDEEMVLSLHRKVVMDSQKCLDELESMRVNGFLDEGINTVSSNIDSKITEKKRNLESKVVEVIDDKYYKSSLKSMLPFGSKERHRELTREKIDKVLDKNSLSNEMKEVVATSYYDFLNSTKDRLRELSLIHI